MNPTPPDTKPICQNFRFWEESKRLWISGYGECQNKQANNGIAEVRSDVFSDDRIYFGKDFGCIHFEKKD